MVLVAWFILFLMGVYAHSLVLSQHILWGLLIFIVDGTLAVFVAYAGKSSESNLPIDPKPESSVRSISLQKQIIRWFLFALMGIAIGSSLNFISSRFSSSPFNALAYSKALYSWLVFLALILVGAIYTAWDDLRDYPKRTLVPLAGLIGFSLAIGLYRLASVPPTLHGDEGMVGIFARKILTGDIATFFSSSWYSLPQFFFFLPSCGLYLFGDNLWGLRMSAVVLGTLSVIPFYLLVREWWRTRTAFWAGCLLIVNQWFIHLMHCGVNYVQVSFFTITLLALWAYANCRRSLELLWVAGGVMGLSLLSYQANHILPVLWIVSQFWLFLLRRISFRWLLLSLIAPLFIALCVISPSLLHDYKASGGTEMFSARSSAVAIWTPLNRQHVDSTHNANGDFSLVMREQIEHALLSTMLYPDKSIQYHGNAPLLDWVTSVLFMLGIVMAAYRFFDPRWSVPAGWILAILLAGGAMTVDTPFYPRLAGITTLLFLPIAGVLSRIMGNVQNESKKRAGYNWAGIAVLVMFVLSAGTNLYGYFQVYALTTSTSSVHYPQTQMALAIQKLDPQTYVYVFGGTHVAFNSGTVKFLAPSWKGEDLDSIPPVWAHRKCAIFVHPDHANLLPTLIDQFPTFTIREHKTPGGITMFTTLLQE